MPSKAMETVFWVTQHVLQEDTSVSQEKQGPWANGLATAVSLLVEATERPGLSPESREKRHWESPENLWEAAINEVLPTMPT